MGKQPLRCSEPAQDGGEACHTEQTGHGWSHQVASSYTNGQLYHLADNSAGARSTTDCCARRRPGGNCRRVDLGRERNARGACGRCTIRGHGQGKGRLPCHALPCPLCPFRYCITFTLGDWRGRCSPKSIRVVRLGLRPHPITRQKQRVLEQPRAVRRS